MTYGAGGPPGTPGPRSVRELAVAPGELVRVGAAPPAGSAAGADACVVEAVAVLDSCAVAVTAASDPRAGSPVAAAPADPAVSPVRAIVLVVALGLPPPVAAVADVIVARGCPLSGLALARRERRRTWPVLTLCFAAAPARSLRSTTARTPEAIRAPRPSCTIDPITQLPAAAE